MAKRTTGVGSKQRAHRAPHKTAKRLAAKRERLAALKVKRGQ